MYQIDVPSAAHAPPASTALGVPGYFTDGDVVGNVAPTIVPAEFLNAVMLELLTVVTGGGLAPTKNNTGQLLLAIENLIEARSGNYAVDTGVANAYVVALNPPIISYTPGLTVKFRALHANTQAGVTLNAGAGALPLVRDDGSPLAAGDIGLNVIISATVDNGAFLVNSIVPSQLGALATLGIGQGLENDGAGGIRVKLADGSIRRSAAGLQGVEPIAAINGNLALTNLHNGTSLVATTDLTLTAPATSTLWNGYNVPVYAQGGAVTFTPNAADKVDSHVAGQSYTLVKGQSAIFTTDGAGNWWPLFKTSPPGSAYPLYLNANTTVAAGQYLVDTSAGPVTLTLTASPVKGDSCRFIDANGTFGTNNLTLLRNGQPIMGKASDHICNQGGEDFILWYNGTEWRLQ